MSYLLTFILASVTIASGAGIPNKNITTAENLFTASSLSESDDETERFEKTYPFSANGRVQVSNVNGSIVVESWDRNEIKFEYTKVASTKERLSEMEVRINAQPDVFTVETKYDRVKRNKNKQWKNNKLYANFKLTVPRGARLDDIETVNGSVTVSNMTNYSVVSAVNGSVKASNIRGTAKLQTVNGTVYADFDSLKDSSVISLGTVNGSVKLLIPSDSNATVKADTLNGSISNEFRLPVRKGKYVGRDMYGKIGNGNVKIKLSSVNGGLSVSRKKDGKNLSPSTNLLKIKSKNDDDFDDDFDIDVSDAKESAREAQRERMEAQRERREEQRARQREEREARREKQNELRKERRERARATSGTLISEAEAEKITKEALKEVEKALENSIDIKAIKVDPKAIEEQLKIAKLAEIAAMEQMRDAMYFRRSPFTVERTDSFKVRANPKVDIDAHNSEIIIRGWGKNEVKYTVTKTKQARNVSPVSVETSLTDTTSGESRDTVSIKVRANNDRSSRNPREFNRIRIEVFVPRKSDLHIHTNQEIRVEGVTGDFELSGKEGAINVRDSKGKLDISTTKGRIRVIGFDGEIKSKTYKGLINLEGDLDKLSAKTTYGKIVLSLPEEKKTQLQDESLNLGFVEKDGKLYHSGQSSLSFTFR